MKISNEPNRPERAPEDTQTNPIVQWVQDTAANFFGRAKDVQQPQDNEQTIRDLSTFEAASVNPDFIVALMKHLPEEERAKLLMLSKVTQANALSPFKNVGKDRIIKLYYDEFFGTQELRLHLKNLKGERDTPNARIEIDCIRVNLTDELNEILEQISKHGAHSIVLMFGKIESDDDITIPDFCTEVHTGDVLGRLDLSQAKGCKVVEIGRVAAAAELILTPSIETFKVGVEAKVKAPFNPLYQGGIIPENAPVPAPGTNTDIQDLSRLVNCKVVEFKYVPRDSEVILGPNVERFKAGEFHGHLNLSQANNCKVIELEKKFEAVPLTISNSVETVKIDHFISGTLDLSQAESCKHVGFNTFSKNAQINFGPGIESLVIRTSNPGSLDLSQAVNCKVVELGVTYLSSGSQLKLGPEVESLKIDSIRGTHYQGSANLDLSHAVKCKHVEIGLIESDALVKLGESVETLETGDIRGILDLRPAVNLQSFSCGKVEGTVIGESWGVYMRRLLGL